MFNTIVGAGAVRAGTVSCYGLFLLGVLALNFTLLGKLHFKSVAEPHQFYVALAPGENFDAAPAPTLLYIVRQNF
jgi:hypothetical protein